MKKLFLLLFSFVPLLLKAQITGISGYEQKIIHARTVVSADSLMMKLTAANGGYLSIMHKYYLYGDGTVGNFNYGSGSLVNLTSGVGDFAVGKDAGRVIADGSYNTLAGYQVFYNANGNENAVIGGYRPAFNQTAGNNNAMFSTTAGADFANLSGSNQGNLWNAIWGTGVNDGTGSTVSTGKIGIFNKAPVRNFDVVGTVRFTGMGSASSDTTTYKPFGINSSGDAISMTAWPVGSGGSPTLTQYHIGVGDASNLLSGSSNLVSDATYRLKAIGKTYLNGTVDIGTSGFGDANVALSVQSGVDWLFNMYNSGASNKRMLLRSTGELGLGDFTPGTATTFEIRNIASNKVGLALKGATSQSQDILEVMDVSSNPYLIVDPSGNTGFGTFTPNSTVQNTGSLSLAYISKDDNYTATINDCVIELAVTGKTITLPTAVGIKGRIYTIKFTTTGSGTVATTSSQTIDGSTTYTLSSQYKFVTVQSTNANWIVIANN